MLIDPISLQDFISAIELGTIAKAAQRERIAPAAVSKRLSELERSLRCQLLTRSNKGIKPTTAGLALTQLGRRVLNDMESVYAQMRGFSSGTRGQIRIYANMAVISEFLPRELEEFVARHPDVDINLEETTSPEIVRAVSENAADVGLFVLGIPTHGLTVFPYHEDELVLVVSNRNPLAKRKVVSLSDILNSELVNLRTGSWLDFQLANAVTAIGGTLKSRIRVTNFEGVVPDGRSGARELESCPKKPFQLYQRTIIIISVKLKESWSRRQLGVCVRSYAELPVASKLLVDHLRQRP